MAGVASAVACEQASCVEVCRWTSDNVHREDWRCHLRAHCDGRERELHLPRGLPDKSTFFRWLLAHEELRDKSQGRKENSLAENL